MGLQVRSRRGALVAGLCALAFTTAIPASATPPGANGLIVFDRGGHPTIELAVVREDGTGLQPLAVPGQAPSWSPDGTRIVFMREVSDEAGDFRLFVANVDGSGVRRVTQSDGPEFQPAWSPGGRTIAFTGGEASFDASDVYVVRADGAGRRRLTFSRGIEYLPTWSPDGGSLAYAGMRHCSVRLLHTCKPQAFVMNADGSAKRRVTRTSTRVLPFSWSPDGTTLAAGVFAKDADGSGPTAIATVRPDGTRFRVITPYADYYQPAWSPDGSRIVFQAGDGLRSVAADGSAAHDIVANGGQPDWQRIAGG